MRTRKYYFRTQFSKHLCSTHAECPISFLLWINSFAFNPPAILRMQIVLTLDCYGVEEIQGITYSYRGFFEEDLNDISVCCTLSPIYFLNRFHMDSRQKYCKFHSQHRFFTISQGGQKMVWEKQVVLGKLLTKMLFCSWQVQNIHLKGGVCWVYLMDVPKHHTLWTVCRSSS
jgi:hypothetical protein